MEKPGTRASTLRGSGAALAGGALVAVAVGLAGHALADRRDGSLAVTVWSAAEGTGGAAYGGPAAAAFVVHRRDVDVGPAGEARFAGVASTIDPATVEVRSLTEPGAAVLEQRLLGDRAGADELLAQQVGRPVVVTLARGELRGVLRAVSAGFLALETDGASGKTVELVRRGDQLVDIGFPAAGVATEPTLVWTLGGARAGKHAMELSYHAPGLSWTPAYTAVLADDDTADFSAWATVRNRSGLGLEGAQVTLVVDDPARPSAPVSFALPRPVTLSTDRDLQVELTPRRAGLRGRRVVVFEAAADLSAGYTTTPAADCYGYAPSGTRAELALELDGIAGAASLPPGRLRVLRRSGGETLLARDERLRVDRASGAVRVKLGDTDQVTGTREPKECDPDPTGRSMRERIQVTVKNDGKAAVDVVIREYLFRWRNWTIEAEDVKGTRADRQAQEYRVKVPPGASRSVTYTVVYSW